ncbi:unnamed protein product [Ceratitis capitata]|uniref:(Mediterranean fruit fly) hypothetical protein n=1 Tax=Ceratitis capitata TaxID=7213 RepID=A0A811UGU5_CERCA|nr:unnamed protein product [Ceratitis capitata]
MTAKELHRATMLGIIGLIAIKYTWHGVHAKQPVAACYCIEYMELRVEWVPKGVQQQHQDN